jgi:hypothetical protein
VLGLPLEDLSGLDVGHCSKAEGLTASRHRRPSRTFSVSGRLAQKQFYLPGVDGACPLKNRWEWLVSPRRTMRIVQGQGVDHGHSLRLKSATSATGWQACRPGRMSSFVDRLRKASAFPQYRVSNRSSNLATSRSTRS